MTGAINTAALSREASGLEALVKTANGEMRARALMQLGTVLRMSNNYQAAITAQTEAAREAEALGLKDLAFDAWIGVARANDNGPADHGAAATAFNRAVDIAGEHPSEKQRADLAGYLAQLEISRGEFEAGIIDALSAIRFANDPKDRFYWELKLADGLEDLAATCDYRPLVDAKSAGDNDDVYGACRRALASARVAYEKAASTAAALGWSYLVEDAHRDESDLVVRGKLIAMQASDEKVTELCENRRFVDGKPAESRNDAQKTCQAAVAAARTVYEQAGMRGLEGHLDTEGKLLDMFHPHSISDVTAMQASRYFRAMVGGGLVNTPALAPWMNRLSRRPPPKPDARLRWASVSSERPRTFRMRPPRRRRGTMPRPQPCWRPNAAASSIRGGGAR